MGQHLQKEIDKLKRLILALGTLVEEHIQSAVKSLSEKDTDLAQMVIFSDDKIDCMEVDIEEEGLKILALHQPVAGDLRFITSVLKINSDLERIGDLGVNIAERALFISKNKTITNIPLDFSYMVNKVRFMLNNSLDALVNADTNLARKVCLSDDEVDYINKEMFIVIEEAMKEKPENIGIYLHLLSCSRHLERIADHATNIAEDVIYMIEGKVVRHKPEEFSRNNK